SAHEAKLRLLAADRAFEQLGLRTRLFAAPHWHASPGAVAALPQCGFRLLASSAEIVDLVRDRAERARVLGAGGGLQSEPWWCRTLLRSADRAPGAAAWSGSTSRRDSSAHPRRASAAAGRRPHPGARAPADGLPLGRRPGRSRRLSPGWARAD
ncbi:hypothetical protein H7H37_00035, partial [Mycolicibacterium insubricum]|nr:hypothetical protein [Mycolicibacterium insubricum]